MQKKTYRYRLRPTKAQETLLEQTLDECRWLYDHLLEQRKTAYEDRSETLNLHDQLKTLPTFKIDRTELSRVHSQVLQSFAGLLDLAFKAFFRRVKAGEKSGYPRFRGREHYNPFTSQTCSNQKCGLGQSMPLSDRVFECPCCHLVLSRDVNAARNILRLGLQSLEAQKL